MTNRLALPTPQWVYWVRRIVALIIIAGLIIGVLRLCSGPEAEDPAPTSTSMAPAPDTTVPPIPVNIAQGRPIELVVPRIGLRAEFEDGDCRVKNSAINPVTMDLACAYTSPDRPYELPGTNADDVVVVAGHTGAGVSGVFNKLYDTARGEHSVHPGDILYVRTTESGRAWLRYVATDVHNPDKQNLPGDEAVWGTGPTPGRLLTISCIQPANLLADSVQNAVVGWQFEGISSGDELAAG